MQDILDKAKNIELVIFDVDGVMTDGSLFMGDNGQEYKAFNSLDGHGMRRCIEHARPAQGGGNVRTMNSE